MDEPQDQQLMGPEADERGPSKTGMVRLAIIGMVAAAFAGLLLAKAVTGPASPPASPSATSITSERNDASADYAEALSSGKPVYVLFHSLS